MKILRPRRLALAAFLLLVCAVPANAREGADPAINQPYLDPDLALWVKRFESPGREVYDQRAAIVAASGVKPGMRVADIGAGTGLFTLLFAHAVGPKGHVTAIDISPTFATNIQRRAQSEKLGNVSTRVNTQADTGLPPASIDLAFVSDTYHHFEQPRAMLASIHRALRAGGSLIVIDFERVEGKSTAWVLGHVRADKKQVIREIEAAGFRLMADTYLLKENFYLRFEKGTTIALTNNPVDNLTSNKVETRMDGGQSGLLTGLKGWLSKLVEDPVATFTGLLFIATVLLWIVTKKSADAAQRSAKISEVALIVTQRAYISANEYFSLAKLGDDKSIKEWELGIVWQNSGQTPAVKVNAGCLIKVINPVSERLDGFFLDAPKEERSTCTVGPRSTIRCLGKPRLTQEQAKKILSNEIEVYLCGFAEYNDTFGEVPVRKTSVCMKLFVDDPTFTSRSPFRYEAHAKYNFAD